MCSANIQISSKINDYQIYFGSVFAEYASILMSVCKDQVMIITDENVARVHLERFKRLFVNVQIDYYVLPAGDSSKKLFLLEDVTTHLLEKKCTRKTTVIALGGGMVGDFSGMVAALYFRGIDYIQIPTSLLSMVDSAVGGKTAVNHALGKNVLGVIYPPKAVFTDIDFLITLEKREFLSGMSEVIKYGLLFDYKFFCWLEDNTKLILQRDRAVLDRLVRRCCKFKADVVSRDEHELNDRMLLNLGHTLAHALEKLTEYRFFLHGEAVSIGLMFASTVSKFLGKVQDGDIKRIEFLLKEFDLPINLDINLSKEEIMNCMLMDKKNYQGSIRMVLLDGIGHGEVCADLSINVLDKALDTVCRS